MIENDVLIDEGLKLLDKKTVFQHLFNESTVFGSIKHESFLIEISDFIVNESTASYSANFYDLFFVKWSLEMNISLKKISRLILFNVFRIKD